MFGLGNAFADKARMNAQPLNDCFPRKKHALQGSAVFDRPINRWRNASDIAMRGAAKSSGVATYALRDDLWPWYSSTMMEFRTPANAGPNEVEASWREALSSAIFSLEIEIDRCGRFQGSLRQRSFGPIALTRIATRGRQLVRRTRGAIAHSSHRQFELIYIQRGKVALSQGGVAQDLPPGHCALVDGGEPYELLSVGNSRGISIHLPDHWLSAQLPHAETIGLKRIGRNAPWGSVLIETIEQIDRLADENGSEPMACSQLSGAVQLAMGGSQIELSSHRRSFNALRRLIADRVSDRDLTAKDLAASYGVSLRYLHVIFASQGTSYGRELIDARLAAATTMLRNPAFAGVSVVEIAWRAGFADETHFRRRFRTMHGVTPGAFRASIGN